MEALEGTPPPASTRLSQSSFPPPGNLRCCASIASPFLDRGPACELAKPGDQTLRLRSQTLLSAFVSDEEILTWLSWRPSSMSLPWPVQQFGRRPTRRACFLPTLFAPCPLYLCPLIFSSRCRPLLVPSHLPLPLALAPSPPSFVPKHESGLPLFTPIPASFPGRLDPITGRNLVPPPSSKT